jgi:hypothetical protein
MLWREQHSELPVSDVWLFLSVCHSELIIGYAEHLQQSSLAQQGSGSQN